MFPSNLLFENNSLDFFRIRFLVKNFGFTAKGKHFIVVADISNAAECQLNTKKITVVNERR